MVYLIWPEGSINAQNLFPNRDAVPKFLTAVCDFFKTGANQLGNVLGGRVLLNGHGTPLLGVGHMDYCSFCTPATVLQ